MLGVVAINGAAIVIRDNRRALQTAVVTILAGFLLVGLAVGGFTQGWLTGLNFMVLTGVGMYVPYVAFHTTLFERMIAVFRDKSNIGYLMYLADAAGYLGYVGVMLFRNFFPSPIHYLDFFVGASLLICLVSTILMILCTIDIQRKMAVARPNGESASEALAPVTSSLSGRN
jgi:hypothetical protein